MSSLTLQRALAVLILAGIGVYQHFAFYQTPGVAKYQAKVAAVATLIPSRIGPWVGEDVPVRVQALTLLRPNVLISRRYVNIETGATASVMFVHCSDAHNMVGHYPARCYPAEGWQMRRSASRDWSAGDLVLTGTEYEFTMDIPFGADPKGPDIIVANFLFRPGGQVLRDMATMSSSIVGAAGQSLGAGQLQVIFDAGIPVEQRDAALTALAEGYRPVIDAVLSKPAAD